MAVKIVVACGSGIATSTLIEQRLLEIAEEEGIAVNISKTVLGSLPGVLQETDLIVTSSDYQGDTQGIPILCGISVITGIGEEKFVQRFVETLRKLTE